MSHDKVYVVLVNWNGWRDTIECLESLLRSDYANYQVIVCDNGSSDGSIEQIRAWAAGRTAAAGSGNPRLAALTTPALEKPLALSCLSRAAAERGGGTDDARLVLVETGTNLGFAGGNNVGLRYALARGDCAWAWLLNNDTVVEPGAMRALVERARRDPDVGMVGSTLLYYDRPERVQARGGATYRPWLGAVQHLDVNDAATEPRDPVAVEDEMSYVVGASMLVSEALLRRVGLLSEEYFLYFEELDLAQRAAPEFSCAFAADSVVYHKEGASMGSSARATRRSALADYYLLRNRVAVTWRHFPLALPSVYAGLAAAALNRVARRQWSRLPLVALAALGPLAPLRPRLLASAR